MENGPYNTDLYNLDAGYMYIVYKGGSEGGVEGVKLTVIPPPQSGDIIQLAEVRT